MSGTLWDHFEQDPESRRLIPKPGEPGSGEAPNLAPAGSTPAPGALRCTGCGRVIDPVDAFTRWVAEMLMAKNALWCSLCWDEMEKPADDG